MITESPRRPPSHWDRLPHDHRVPHVERFSYAGLLVLSEINDMEAPDGSKESIPQWLVTVSKNGKRVSDDDLDRVRRAFGMEQAEEDNHHPGVSRALFLCVDPDRRATCECKADESTVVEPDGYTWSNDVNDCRGCEYERLRGKPCAVHRTLAPS